VALLHRTQTGEGQWVQCSLLQAMVAMLDFQAERWLLEKQVAPQAGNDHPTAIPTGVFETSDGHINIAATGAAIYERFCKLMGREDWMTDERYATGGARSRNRKEMNAEINELTRTRTSEEWIEAFNEAGVPAGPIYSIDEVFADPQVQHLGMAAPVHHPKLGDIELVGQAVNLSSTAFKIRSAPPELGEHTDEILEGIGYHAAAIEALRKERVI
jgi:formyl-CoA transferase